MNLGGVPGQVGTNGATHMKRLVTAIAGSVAGKVQVMFDLAQFLRRNAAYASARQARDCNEENICRYHGKEQEGLFCGR